MERRGATRYHLRMPVVFRCTDGKTESPASGGFTRDVSTKGVFVICDVPPPPTTCVAIEILLTPLEPEIAGLRLEGSGVVVRIDQTGGGFAMMGALETAGALGKTVASASSGPSVDA